MKLRTSISVRKGVSPMILFPFHMKVEGKTKRRGWGWYPNRTGDMDHLGGNPSVLMFNTDHET